MIYGIRIMAIILFVSMVGFGCSGESQDKPADLKTTGRDSVKVVSDENVKQDRPLVTFVELGSVKCIPCKMMQPIMKEIETEYAGQVEVVFHDVWTEAGRPYAEQYGIRAIPTQVFLDSEGKEYSRHEGFFPKEELVKVLKQKGVQ